MAVKTIGIIMLFLTAFHYSRSHQKAEDLQCGILTELCSLFSYIQKNIDCFTKSLGEIGREYTSPLLEEYGFYTIWKQHSLLHAIESIPCIPLQTRELLLQYARSAGQGYKEEELHLCRYTHEHLQEMLTMQKEERNTKNRMYRTLPYLLVLSIVLLLY